MKILYKFILLLFTVQIFSNQSIRIIPVEQTPQPENVAVTIVFPEHFTKEKKSPIWMQIRLRGYALGTESQFARAREIASTDRGQTLHIIVDNRPYFPISSPGIDPYDLIGDYYQATYKFELPYDLKDGLHTLRVYCARSFGESLKSDESYDAIYFYLNDKSASAIKLGEPLLSYNQPSMRYFYKETQPILLDFFLTNCELSERGYKVRVTIDDDYKQTLSEWLPYYIYGLKRGKHMIRLELIDSEGRLASGEYNQIEQAFIVH